MAEALALQRYTSWTPQDREDLVSEVMIKYFRKFGRDSSPVNPRGWVGQVLRTTAIDLHRAKPRERPVDPQPVRSEALQASELDELLGITLRTPSLSAVSGDLLGRVFALVDTDQAELLRWKYLEGASAADISERTNRTLAATNQAVNRAKKALHAALVAESGLAMDLRSAFPRLY